MNEELIEALMNVSEAETCDEYLNTEEELKKSIAFEGYLLKTRKTSSELKKVYAVLIDKNIYFYSQKTSKKENYTKTHYLGGGFIKANAPELIGNEEIFSFTIILQNDKQKKFYHESQVEVNNWVEALRESIRYRNLFDDYNILVTLGEGQYGKVTLGTNLETKQEVAIKIIAKKKVKDTEVWEMIRTEIDILKISKHPNIVSYIDNYENSDYIFIVMEYVKSGTLQSFLKDRKFNITEKLAAKIAYQIADALKYLQTYGIMHRDLKPDNVMIANNPVDENDLIVKLTDFGFGKIIGYEERALEGYGTLGFVSPEVLLRSPYNGAVDVWSLGCTVFFMLSGDIPFKGKTKDETSQMICKKELIFPMKFKKLSVEALELMYSCLVKKPQSRISIDKVLSHNWFKRYNISSLVKTDKY